MRKRFRVLLLAAIVAALVVPVGFALSLESTPGAMHTPRTAVATVPSAAVASSMVLTPVHVDSAAPLLGRTLPDAGKLLLVGTVLFGLAAAVRKAV
jgi:hypothetical protein